MSKLLNADYRPLALRLATPWLLFHAEWWSSARVAVWRVHSCRVRSLATACGVIIFFGLLSPTADAARAVAPSQMGSDDTVQREPLYILGVNPPQADVNAIVRVRLSRPTRNLALIVGGVPTESAPDSDGLWWEFRVPMGIAGTNPLIVALDSTATSEPFEGLRVLPLRITKVSPAHAPIGAEVSVSLSSKHPFISTARVLFDRSTATITSRGADSLVVVVPGGLVVGSQPLIALLVGDDSLSSSAFTVTATSWSAFFQKGIGYFIAVLLGGVLLVLWLGLRRLVLPRRNMSQAGPRYPARVEQGNQYGEVPPPMSEVQPVLPPPAVSPELVEACVRGECVLFVGAGLSAQAGFPLWRPFITELLEWSAKKDFVDDASVASMRAALHRGAVDRVADNLVTRAQEGRWLPALHQHMREVFTVPHSRRLPDVHRSLTQIGFAAALTTNFDRLLELAFGDASVPVRMPSEVEALKGDLAHRRFFILKLYGDADHPESLLLSPAQYEESIRGDRPFGDLMQEIFLTKTILFLGCSLDGIEAYLKGLRMQPLSVVRHHALVGVSRPGWEVDAEGLERRYGIGVVPYSASGDHVAVQHFVTDLQQSVMHGKRDSEVSNQGSPRIAHSSRLRSLELHNIGPFEKLEIHFDSGWTLLLGDNGVGKSTVIKAIALAVAGEAAGPLAGRLLKAGTSEGQIVVKSTNDRSYYTRIALDSLRRAEAKSIGPRAFAGEALVIAFPSMRAIASGATKAPQSTTESPSPGPQDVMPMLTGLADPRILEIKQWIVNLDYRMKGSDKTRSAAIRRLLDQYFEGLSTLLDIPISSWRISETDVMVTTRDGELPLDAMSQGTVSIFGWVGVLLKRLYDSTGDPHGSAIVLVDEIDAHMHPEWQQAMVSRLKTAFPNVQFIATTHSPFLALGRNASEIIRLRRDRGSGQLSAESPEHDTTHMTVASVLVSQLFGLQSQLDYELQSDLLTKRRLSVKPNLDDNERRELQRVGESLKEIDPSVNIRDPAFRLFLQELNRRTNDIGSDAADPEQMAQQSRAARSAMDELVRAGALKIALPIEAGKPPRSVSGAEPST